MRKTPTPLVRLCLSLRRLAMRFQPVGMNTRLMGCTRLSFLICRACGGVTEIADTPRILDMLRTVCREKAFTMQSASVEVEGLCAACAARQAVDGARKAGTEQ
jgi:Fe2+ or Zn2+ uptake regulation protein